MTQAWTFALSAALLSASATLGGCGLAETGATAASAADAQAQPAAQARQMEQRVKQRVEEANSQAADRERAAVDAAGR